MTSADQGGVLFVSGEPSGDRIAAGIAMALAPAKIPCFGMGGEASAGAGIEIVADIRRSAAMGFTEVATRLPRLAMSFARLSSRIRRQRPRAAVLVNYTEYNHLLGRRLRRSAYRSCGALLRRSGRGDPNELLRLRERSIVWR